MDPYATSHISNAALRRDLETCVANDCKSTAVLLSRIAEFDARRLYRDDGYPSMYSYCMGELHFCEGTASWRIYAARAARRFPVLFDAVADGRLHVTAVVMLRKYLSSGNVDDLIEAATHKSKAGIEQLIANRFPRPDLPERLETIPTPCTPAGPAVAQHRPANAGPAAHPPGPLTTESNPFHWPGNVGAVDLPTALQTAGPAQAHWPANAAGEIPSNIAPGPGPIPLHSEIVHAGNGLTMSWSVQHWPANAAAPPPRAKVARLAPERFGLQVTIDQETHDLLQQARELMSHLNPCDEIAPVLKSALRLLVAHLEKRKFAATARPRNGSKPHAKADENGRLASRHIPADVKRAVWERDGGRCTFVSEEGLRCPARAMLEFDHREPVARGGESTVNNVHLACRAHNEFAAERAFGAAFMDHKRREGRERVKRERPVAIHRD